ncbi:hypothetical protein [Pseudomonas sp. URIL14HWK12:I5]|uniref:hypothetical protein n=1 Tax=Pseudomonas sp. URIL14HWK12:I5 TaxID=1261630 RepID=UPI000A01C630|nr:hypothetical protein [Pseudomonas sp. URIL14HWK12:I5]
MIQPIDTLRIMDVQNHGVANQERIAIFVQKMCDLAEYCLILTLPTPEGGAVPVKDHMLWFGQGVVNPGDWIFVYTAAGSTTILPNLTNQPLPGFPPLRYINMHWGKDHTVFQNRALSPMLIRIGGTGTLLPPAPTYQGNVNSAAQPRLF